MRPRSTDREALLHAAATLAGGTLGGGTCHQLAALAGLPLLRARSLADNARRAGELQVVGSEQPQGRGRPVARYAPAAQGFKASSSGHLQAVQAAMGAWRSR